MRWLIENPIQSMFIRSNDQLVFYSHGPFSDYVLPTPAYQPIILGAVSRLLVFSFVTSFIAAGIGIAFGFGTVTMAIVGLIDYFWYFLLIRRLTKRLIPLPFGLGFRFYARWYDEERLYQRLFASVFGFALVGWALQVNPSPLMIIALALSCYIGLVSAILLWFRFFESTRAKS